MGYALCLAGLIASLALAAFAVGPFTAIGIWYQSEPVIAAGFAAAALCALGLALAAGPGGGRGDVLAHRVIAHPLVLLPLALAGWSLAVAPLARFPIGSLLGSPQLGEGVASYLALAAVAAAALLAYRTRRGRRLLGGAALLLAALAAALTLSGRQGWMPYFFPDFLAFYGFFAWAIAMAWLPARGPGRTLRAVVTVAALALVLASGNRAAIAAVVPGAVTFVIWHRCARRRATPALRWSGAALAAALPLAATATVAWLHYSGVAARLGDAVAGTLGSRARMLSVVADAVADRPLMLLTGNGWGSFTEMLLAHLPLPDVILHPAAAAAGATFWDALDRADFHSHNFLAEALAGGGLPAMLLVLALPAVLPLMAPRRRLAAAMALAVMLGLTQAMWFQMPVTPPYMMVAFAGLCPWRRARDARPSSRRVGAGFALAALLLLATTAAVLDIAVAGRRAAEANLAATAPAPSAACAPVLDDLGRGEEHFVWLYRQLTSRLMDDARAGRTPAAASVARMDRYLCRAAERARHSNGRRLRVADAIIRGDLAFVVGDKAPALVQRATADWPQALDRVLAVAPKRTDLLAAWFFWKVRRGDDAAILTRAAQILARNPGDPVALWFSGLALLGDPARQTEGMARLRRALDNGVTRVFPVDPKTVEAVRRQH